jgi:hypothetical protein
MKFRKLRIAWSVGWGVVAVLLCVLWVRSYWRCDGVLRVDKSIGQSIASNKGILYVSIFQAFSSPQPNLITGWERFSVVPHEIETGFRWSWEPLFKWFQCPHWFVGLVTAVVAASPWLPLLRWRFSLRTLLIATTLVAAVLGVIVYAVR